MDLKLTRHYVWRFRSCLDCDRCSRSCTSRHSCRDVQGLVWPSHSLLLLLLLLLFRRTFIYSAASLVCYSRSWVLSLQRELNYPLLTIGFHIESIKIKNGKTHKHIKILVWTFLFLDNQKNNIMQYICTIKYLFYH